MNVPEAGSAFLLSVAFNAGVIGSLAYLGEPELPDDATAPPPIRPNVVEPPKRAPSGEKHPLALDRPRPEPKLPEVPAPPPLAIPPLGPADLPVTRLAPKGAATGSFDRGFEMLASRSRERDRELPSRPPRVARTPDLSPYYPRTAQRQSLSGRTIIRVQVDARGAVRGVEVLKSEPPGVFDDAARQAGRAFRFDPALERGRPTSGTTRLELVWSRR